jgi:DNA polymerase-4
VGDLTRLDSKLLERHFGKWGLALAGKARGEDAGGWFDRAFTAGANPKSISHEHTYSEDTADLGKIDATLIKLSEMVARRLREHHLHTRTVQLKLRYSDFSTFTRAHTLDHPTQLDTVIAGEARALFRANWEGSRAIRLLGVQVSQFTEEAGQIHLLESTTEQKWRNALTAVDKLRDRYGEGSISLAGGLQGTFRRRIHEAKEHEIQKENESELS